MLEQACVRFPAREAGRRWPLTDASADEVLAVLERPPLRAEKAHTRWHRRSGARAILAWLSGFDGDSWQERWEASPAAACPQRWRREAEAWVNTAADVGGTNIQAGLLVLAAADVIRLSLPWQMDLNSCHVRTLVEESRDPEGFARLKELAGTERWASASGGRARRALVRIMVAKGGGLADITVGDVLEYDAELRRTARGVSGGGTLYYAWLRELGHLPTDAPTTLRFLERVTGQLTCAQLVDRHPVASGSIRALIVDYLEERRPRLDYSTLDNLARHLTRNFWADIERHHPEVDTLHLPADIAAAWKERLRTRIQRRRRPDGSIEETVVERADRVMIFIAVRAFYLDIARWAGEEPGRWGPWVAPCPIKVAETADRKRLTRTKARMDQRTRERLPLLETFARAAAEHHRVASAHLQTARSVPPGGRFTLDDAPYTRGTNPASAAARDAQGRLVHLDRVEHRAFWAWASIEFLRHTGARVEEMLETTHHAMIQYRLPTTGEIVPLLQIAPSKTDVERVLLISPELADVLATIIRRVRDPKTGLIPLVTRYDCEERQWNAPAPVLFQYNRGGEPSTLNSQTIREILKETVAFMRLTDATGQPLTFTPQDFRRMFITDAIRTGLPPHIAQVIAGHANINTTMGYNAVYPTETIEAHRAFIARRRTLRPSEEYRTPTDAEWEDFLGHFERRKLSVGTCARAYGTACIHEHACVRCSLLRPDPAQRSRLVEIRENLLDRIAEAEREGWLGEIEGLRVSLAGAESKIGQIDSAARPAPVLLGLPTPRPARK
ncbi:site-specific integrase [Streptomyces sp. MB09-01]|uniref:site-specific integrase n=1 Tax=Streptomyces sp. MB09-01 TaxID=3028666 RepID=UPI0029BED859|nr:site-specific integrase [Streptomyces sp. MB09-01]MDX3539649.1 site-specific integrase [Streptomyces sp. MB09-01]